MAPTPAGTLSASHVYGHYIDEPVQSQRDIDGAGSLGLQSFYYHPDDLFSVTCVTAGPGGVSVPVPGGGGGTQTSYAQGQIVERYRYGDYGSPTFFSGAGSGIEGSRIANTMLFTGREWDADIKFYYYRTRYMEPGLGRFASRDRIGTWGDVAGLGCQVQYGASRPQITVDPTGELVFLAPVVIKALSAVAVAVKSYELYLKYKTFKEKDDGLEKEEELLGPMYAACMGKNDERCKNIQEAYERSLNRKERFDNAVECIAQIVEDVPGTTFNPDTHPVDLLNPDLHHVVEPKKLRDFPNRPVRPYEHPNARPQRPDYSDLPGNIRL